LRRCSHLTGRIFVFADVGIAQETVAHRGVRHDHRRMYEVCARSEIVSQTAGYVLTSIEWQPLSVAAEETLRRQFWAELSAFTSLAIIVPVIVGWLTQKQLVRGPTTGAVK
jgi:hypothetical protein